MSNLSRVVWSEGMHLAQHHFQTQSGYFESLIGFTLSHLFFKPYGLVGCELDAEALRNGTVSVRHARGIMPDGLAFHFPLDPPPESLEVRDLFSPTHDSHRVLLAIPPYRPNHPNIAPEAERNHREVRFLSATEQVRDEATGQDVKPVAVARKNFRLLLDTEGDEDHVTLPLARVRRDGAGHFIYDPEYIAPSLQIGASEALMQMLGRLLEMLDAKAESMLRERQGTHASLAEYASREVASFWLSHAVHSSLAPLHHHHQVRNSHPEQLYLEMARLAGALCTFALSAHPRDLPLYDHDQLDRCFGALDRHIREHLDIVLPTNSVFIPLQPAEEHFYTGAVTDPRCFGRSHWLLGVRSSAGQGEVITRVPKLVKICSAKHIMRLVREAYPGLTLEHVASPPNEISPRLGTQYFHVRKEGPCWKSMVETTQVGVYAPAAIPGAELELAIVLER